MMKKPALSISDATQLQLSIEKSLRDAGIPLTEDVMAHLAVFGLLYDRSKLDELRESMDKLPMDFTTNTQTGDLSDKIAWLEDYTQKARYQYNKAVRVEQRSLLQECKDIITKSMADDAYDPMKRIKLNHNTKFSEVTNQLEEGYYIICAEPNIGKSAFAITIADDALISNSDTCILYYTLDDYRSKILSRFVACRSRMLNPEFACAIRHVNKKRFEAEAEANRLHSWQCVTQWVAEGRLDIIDKNDCKTLYDVEADIKRKKNRYDKPLIFIDGVLRAKKPDWAKNMKIFDYSELCADLIDDLSTAEHLSIITTNEISKNKERGDGPPSSEDIKGTNRWASNAKVAIMLYAENKKLYKAHDNNTLNVYVEKNKLSEDHPVIKYQMFHANSLALPLAEGDDIRD